MWPMYVDYSDDECKRLLRTLELEAYAAIISAFRAQGCLTKDKRKMLQELCTTLSISVERHRAEIRRAVNDEHLNTVAERLYGPNTSTEWSIEGRRVVPLMQRLAPQTVFTDIANSAANAQATKNASLPLPGRTGLREISNGVETMASRKRKELPSDPYIFPSKIQAKDNQPFSSMTSFDSPSSQNVETPHVPEITTAENLTANEASSQETPPLSNYISSEIPTMAHVPSLVSPVKSNTKQMMKSSTVTTFASFDQMASNLLSSKPASRSPLQSIGHEGHLSSVADILKPVSEPKSLQRSSSTGTMRTTVIPNTVPSTGTTSSSDRSSSSVPSQSKFVSQLRTKPPVTGRQNLPSGLGVKLNIQAPVTQRAMSPKSSGSKLKTETSSGSSFLTKKTSTGVFPTTCQPESTSAQFTLSESLTITKTPPSVRNVGKTEPQTTSSHQTTSKVPVTKSLPKASTSSSQYISRSLFGSGTKGAKTLPPVIFNVATSTASHQTTTKTTGPAQSEANKGSTSTQLLPKSTAIGVSQSHMKLSGPTTQTIQYRNDGGLVRSARIINVTPPAGSRLPCSITPSAISALGLSSNLTSGALRVTLPAGTLNTSSSMRASAVAKPNVIVVHKAQMWPRSQGAAVIMSSTPMQRMPGDTNQENSQKQDKSKAPTTTTTTTTTKPPARPHTSPRPQSPIVSSAPPKATEPGSVCTSSPNAVPQTDTPASKENPAAPIKNTSTTNLNSTNSSTLTPTKQKSTENVNEAQCKRNLLADVIEASGLLEGPNKSLVKDKDAPIKKEPVKQLPKGLSSNTSNETPVKNVLDSTTSKPDEASIKFDKLLMESMKSSDSKNGQTLQVQDKIETVVIQSTEAASMVQSLENVNTAVKNQTEDPKNQNT